MRRTRTLHLAAAIDGGEEPAGSYLELVRLAERGALDFVTLAGGEGDSGDDALAVLTRLAPATDRVGVVPALAASSAPPAELALAVAALDRVSQGRAGWALAVPGAAAGRGRAERAEARWRHADEVAAAVSLAWDADGDLAGGAGSRTPQGRPVIAVDATEPAARTTAARHADVAFVRAARPDQALLIRNDLRRLAMEAGRDPDRLLVLGELAIDLGGGELGPEPGADSSPAPDGTGGVLFSGGPVDLADLIADWQRSGAVDGFHVRPVEPRRDLERFVNGTVALLQHRGLFRSFHPGATLREHLALRRPVPHPAPPGQPFRR
ncbi:LLM class flavin-dependent oxidoreductase [Streptomyces sp. NBC_01476]|uniref:LLM class flavin-dependent oxidoreductase n=1 Tax=Streptomyces sp. NBC_01476 TaxID=2903881 RepID=UPI002E37A97E|nr:LLM class flavin-dependent oxidoreductase [Streptomyces sp. NBC_01476]